MTIYLGQTAPDFTADTTMGTVSLHDWASDSWVFFFSHPSDFTAVCTTEMSMTAKYAADFAARNVKPLGLSADSVEQHEKWAADLSETNDGDFKFPIIADGDLVVAKLYDMIHANVSKKATVRCVFIIDPDKKIRLTMTYPMNVGRNFDEILRVIDALQIADEHSVALPANWTPGDEVAIPGSVSTKDAKAKYPDLKVLKPYLRVTKDY